MEKIKLTPKPVTSKTVEPDEKKGKTKTQSKVVEPVTEEKTDVET